MSVEIGVLGRYLGISKHLFVNSSRRSFGFQQMGCHTGIPKLFVSPKVALVDILPRIKMKGLSSGYPITLLAETVDDKQQTLKSTAHYFADGDGEVDVKYCASVGGHYVGVCPAGLFTTLRLNKGNFNYGRMYRKHTYGNYQVKITAYKGHDVHNKAVPLDSVTVDRLHMIEGVKRIPVKTGRIRGSLFLPPGDGPHPGVIDMFGAGGILFESRAALSASHGIASLCLAYFRYEDLTTQNLFHQEMEYFEEAVDYLTSYDGIISDRCGVIGNCQGGIISQLMGIHIDKVKAVFAINFPFHSFFSDFTYQNRMIAKGLRMSSVHMDKLDDDFLTLNSEMREYISSLTDSYVNVIPTLPKDKFFHWAVGEDDCYKFCNGLQNFQNKFSVLDRKNIVIKTYPQAGHIIDIPYTPTTEKSLTYFWVDQKLFPHTDHELIKHHFGGDHVSSVKMQEDVWKDYFTFFNEHIRDESSIDQDLSKSN